MQVTLRYRLTEQGRKSALLAGRPATELVQENVDCEDLAPLADVLTVDPDGTPVIDARISTNIANTRSLTLDAPPADAAALAEIVRGLKANISTLQARQAEEQAASEARQQEEDRQRHQECAAAVAAFMADPDARRTSVLHDYLRLPGCSHKISEREFPGAHEEEKRRREADADAVQEARAAKDAADREWSRAFVAAHGTESQQARFAAGLLPEDELVELAYAVVMAPLAGFAPYPKMTEGDVPCECEDDGYGPVQCEVRFSSRVATEATDAQWQRLQEIRAACAADAALVGAQVTLYRHTGERTACDGTETRTGVMVEVQAGPLELRREFAAD